MAKQQKKLGEILVEWGIINAKELVRALDHAKSKNFRIGEALLDLKLCNEANVYKALAQQQNMEYFDLDKSSVPANATTLIPEELIRKYLVLPLGMDGSRLRVAVHDPVDMEMEDILRFRLNREIRKVLAPKNRIKAIIDQLFNSGAGGSSMDKTMDKTIDRLRDSLDKSLDRSLDKSVDRSIDKSIDVAGMGEDAANDPTQAPVIKLVSAMISEAVRNRASDIHIEPMKDRIRVRYRIDGECVDRDRISLRMKGPLISRIKIMAGVDIAEKRLPQDGRIKMQVDKQMIDFRVSTLPAYHGESVVLRILRPDSVRIGIQNLGFEEEDYKVFQKIIKRPNGIFLVTGPTGSGKTTTLYGALNELNRPDKKIITAEDPVEYNFIGINQCQVRENIGLTFAKILRAMLRQAPNIILVGEIRDLEVAEVAIQAALTGHLVFSTLHTNDAPSSITRLFNLEIEPYLVGATLSGILAQRLVRKLCQACREPYEPTPNEIRALEKTPGKVEVLYRAKGCARCHNRGYTGRIGVHELLVPNDVMVERISAGASLNELKDHALKSGLVPLRADGIDKVKAGLTTLEEVHRVTA